MTEILVDLLAENDRNFDSSSIDKVGYDRENKALFVQFSHGDAVYEYGDVEESTYNLFIEADSLNAFWRKHLSGSATRHDGVDLAFKDYDPQPEQKWLSVPPGETPDFAQGGAVVAEGEQDALVLNGEGIFAVSGGLLSALVIAPTRYAVEYTVEHDGTSGRYKPEFQAMSEADALAQFNKAVSGLTTVLGWTDIKVKIVSVTHYFD